MDAGTAGARRSRRGRSVVADHVVMDDVMVNDVMVHHVVGMTAGREGEKCRHDRQTRHRHRAEPSNLHVCLHQFSIFAGHIQETDVREGRAVPPHVLRENKPSEVHTGKSPLKGRLLTVGLAGATEEFGQVEPRARGRPVGLHPLQVAHGLRQRGHRLLAPVEL
jgi:hypothetical protein